MSSVIRKFDEDLGPISPDYTQVLEVINNQAVMNSFVTKPLLYNQFVAKPGLQTIICSDEKAVLMSYKFSPKIEKWDTDTNSLNTNFINNVEAPEFFDITKNKKILYSISQTKNVRFFNSETGKPIGKNVKLDQANAAFVMINKDENCFAGRIDNQTVGIFNIENGKTEQKIHDMKLAKYMLSPDFSKIFVLKNDGSWQLRDVESGKVDMKGTKAVTSVRFSGDDKSLMIIYGDANVEILDLKNFKPFIKLNSIINATGDFSEDGAYFAISEDVNLIRIWSVKDKKPIGESIPSTKNTTFFRFSEDGSKIFVTDNSDQTLQNQINIFDTKTGKNVTVPFAVSRIQRTDVFPGEKRVLTVNFDMGTAPIISIWEIPGQLKISSDQLANNLENYFGKKYDLKTGTISSITAPNLDRNDWFFQDPYSRTITPNSKFTIMDKVKEYIPIKNVRQLEILTNNYIYHPYTRAVLALHYAQQPETGYIAHNLYKMTRIQLGKVKDPKLKSEVEKLLNLTAQKIYPNH